MYKKDSKTECKDACVTFQTKMKRKEEILKEMKKRGLRVTNQRSLIIDIILSSECTCCKEIFYQTNRIDRTIGIATVYRMVKTLEEIGVIDRRNLYRIYDEQSVEPLEAVECELKNDEVIRLTCDEIKLAVSQWLERNRTSSDHEIVNIYQCVMN